MLVPYAILNRSRKSSCFEAFYSTQELLLTLIFQSNWGKVLECWTNSLLWGRVRAIWYVGYLFSLSKWCWIRWPHLPHLMADHGFRHRQRRSISLWFIYSSWYHMSPRIQFQQDQIRCTGRAADNEAAAYIVFTNISSNIVKNSEYDPRVIGGKNIRIFSKVCDSWLSRWLQDRTKSKGGGGQLDRIFSSKFETMGLEQEVVATGRKRIKEFPYSKEPDHSWKPPTVAQARSTKWPTLVVERGWTESLNRLHLDAEW